MIIYNILKAISNLRLSFFKSFPAFDVPDWVYSTLPSIFDLVEGFNYYLPILELCTLVASVIAFTLSWKIIKVLLSIFIDLNA